jgi:hypothetical protein
MSSASAVVNARVNTGAASSLFALLLAPAAALSSSLALLAFTTEPMSLASALALAVSPTLVVGGASASAAVAVKVSAAVIEDFGGRAGGSLFALASMGAAATLSATGTSTTSAVEGGFAAAGGGGFLTIPLAAGGVGLTGLDGPDDETPPPPSLSSSFTADPSPGEMASVVLSLAAAETEAAAGPPSSSNAMGTRGDGRRCATAGVGGFDSVDSTSTSDSVTDGVGSALLGLAPAGGGLGPGVEGLSSDARVGLGPAGGGLGPEDASLVLSTAGLGFTGAGLASVGGLAAGTGIDGSLNPPTGGDLAPACGGLASGDDGLVRIVGADPNGLRCNETRAHAREHEEELGHA